MTVLSVFLSAMLCFTDTLNFIWNKPDTSANLCYTDSKIKNYLNMDCIFCSLLQLCKHNSCISSFLFWNKWDNKMIINTYTSCIGHPLYILHLLKIDCWFCSNQSQTTSYYPYNIKEWKKTDIGLDSYDFKSHIIWVHIKHGLYCYYNYQSFS